MTALEFISGVGIALGLILINDVISFVLFEPKNKK